LEIEKNRTSCNISDQTLRNCLELAGSRRRDGKLVKTTSQVFPNNAEKISKIPLPPVALTNRSPSYSSLCAAARRRHRPRSPPLPVRSSGGGDWCLLLLVLVCLPNPLLACLDSMRAFLNLCAKSGFGSVLNRTQQVPAQFNGSFWFFFSFAGFTPRRRSLFSVKFGGLSEFNASPSLLGDSSLSPFSVPAPRRWLFSGSCCSSWSRTHS